MIAVDTEERTLDAITLGRILVEATGASAVRWAAGAASPVAIAPRGYRGAAPAQLQRVGVGVDESDEAQRALEVAVALARKSEAAVRVITAFERSRSAA